jgi:hypothetical protein
MGVLEMLQISAPAGKRERAISRAMLPKAIVEFHLVGESQGPKRQEYLRTADFLGSITLGYSNRSNRCPVAGNCNRPRHRVDGILRATMLSMALELARNKTGL